MKIIFLLINILLNALIVNSTFQSSIFSEVNLDFEGKNVILSPLSIFQVLGLTTNGGVGTTQKEMISTLETSSLDNLNNINLKIIEKIKKFVSVELANGVMSIFEPIKSFSKICDKYEAPIEKLISKKQVNDWCSKNTHGKITEILDELNPATSMLLLKACMTEIRLQLIRITKTVFIRRKRKRKRQKPNPNRSRHRKSNRKPKPGKVFGCSR